MIRWLVPLLWLLVVWVALWEQVTPTTVVGGVAVALVLLAAFRPGGGVSRWTLRPWAGLRFAAYFIYQFVIANVDVARAVIFPSTVEGRQAIIEVPVAIDNPAVLAILTSAVSLTPGTSVVEVSQRPSVLYLHVLEFHSVEDVHRNVGALESRLVRAFGGTVDDPHHSKEER